MCLPLLGTAPAAAQDHGAPPPRLDSGARGTPTVDLLVPIHTAEPDAGVPYGVWAAGSSYKASFHDGATFVPLLGTAYPHNLPFAWRTVSVRAGSQELLTRVPHLTWTATRAEYDLGGVVEAYDVRSEGLEQTFVLRERPRAAGDLEVRGAVTTELHAEPSPPAHRALTFRDAAGRAIVTYGAATAVDARGARCAMTTQFAAGEIVLRLDGAWLADASFPVVVDPLLGTATHVVGAPRTEVDIVQEPTSIGDSTWIAYAVAASASDSDLYVQRWSYGGSLGSTAFVDVTSSWSTSGARCAFASGIGWSITVFDRLFASGSRSLRYHRHARTDGASNTTFGTIATTDNAWRADVGTVSNNPAPHALVVWQQEPNGGGPFAESASSDIHGCTIDLLAGTAGTPFPIATAVLTDHERPSTTKLTSGGAFDWLIAYQTYNTLLANDDWDVVVRQVDQSGNVSPALTIDNTSPDHKMAPVIDGTAGDFAVAFTSSTLAQQPGKPAGINGHQIRLVRVEKDFGTGTLSEPFGTVLLQSNADARLELAGLAIDRDTQSHWALMFRSNASEQLYLRTVGYRGQQLQALTVFNPAGSDVSVRGGVSFSSNYRTFSLAYAINGSGSNYVTFDRYDHPAVQGAAATGPGCSTASIVWDGSQLIGSWYNHLRVLNAPPNSIHLLVVATAPAQGLLVGIPPFVDGCWLLVPNVGPDHLGILVDVGQTASWHFPLPEFLVSATFYFQDFHTDASGNFSLVSTQRLEVPVVR